MKFSLSWLQAARLGGTAISWALGEGVELHVWRSVGQDDQERCQHVLRLAYDTAAQQGPASNKASECGREARAVQPQHLHPEGPEGADRASGQAVVDLRGAAALHLQPSERTAAGRAVLLRHFAGVRGVPFS